MADSVPVDLIERERDAGWPTIHPEDFCHRCGARNMVWFASADLWKAATSAWAAETGREGICCPACFADLYKQATGNPRTIWEVRPWSPPTETTALAEVREHEFRCDAHDVEGMRCLLDAPHPGALHKTPCSEGGHWRWSIDCGPPASSLTVTEVPRDDAAIRALVEAQPHVSRLDVEKVMDAVRDAPTSTTEETR